MSDLSRMGVERLAREAPAAVLEGTVLDPPLDDNGWLRVELDSQRGVVYSCPWLTRYDMTPGAGDAVAVIESDQGNFWAVSWWPQSGQTPIPPGAGLPEVFIGPDPPSPRDARVLWIDTDEQPSPPLMIERRASLPSSPRDGQEVFFVADEANGVIWHLRYNALSTSPYKWEFAGGPALRSDPDGSYSARSFSALVALTLESGSAAPTLTVPRAGVYDVLLGAQNLYSDVSGITLTLGLGVNGAVSAWEEVVSFNSPANDYASTERTRRRALAAGDTLTIRGAGGGAGWAFCNGLRLGLTPVRVG